MVACERDSTWAARGLICVACSQQGHTRSGQVSNSSPQHVCVFAPSSPTVSGIKPLIEGVGHTDVTTRSRMLCVSQFANSAWQMDKDSRWIETEALQITTVIRYFIASVVLCNINIGITRLVSALIQIRVSPFSSPHSHAPSLIPRIALCIISFQRIDTVCINKVIEREVKIHVARGESFCHECQRN